MVLELSQGKEGTAAGYAEYTRLEEEYAWVSSSTMAGSACRGIACRRSATSARGCRWTRTERARWCGNPLWVRGLVSV
eukprot:3681371-Prymnesium_polylepis.1